MSSPKFRNLPCESSIECPAEQLSHDLRNQLTNLNAQINLLEKTNLANDQAILVDRIKSSSDKILSLVVKTNEAPKAPALGSRASPLGLLAGKTALLLEDDHLSRIALTKMLADEGVACEAFETFTEAKLRLKEKTFDFFIVDYFHNNNKEDGLGFILNIKNDSAFNTDKSIFVLISGASSVFEFSKHAVDLCFLKPISAGFFLGQLAEALAEKMSESQFVDKERLHQYLNAQLLDRLVAIFEADVPQQIFALQHSIEHKDIQKVKYFVHCLISKSKTIGATRMAEYCFELEKELPAKQWENMTACAEKIQNCFLQTLKYLKTGYGLN